MRHKYLPRFRAGVLPAALAAGAGLGAGACSDSGTTGPVGRNGLRLDLVSVTPPDSSSGRLGVEFKVRFHNGTPVNGVLVYVDSGTAAQHVLTVKPSYPSFGVPDVSGPAFTDTPGRHTFTVVATRESDTLGASVRFERTFTVRNVSYAVTVLPDLGSGAGVRGLTPSGVVTGWVTGSDGHQRAAMWKGGALTVLTNPDTVDVVAVATNDAGDVLLQYGAGDSYSLTPMGPGSHVAVRHADGTTVTLGPVGTPDTSNFAGVPNACCTIAAGVNERRQVLAYGHYAFFGYGSAIFDAASGGVKDSTNDHYLLLNNNGQLLGEGYFSAGFGYDSRYLIARGFTLPQPTTVVGLTLPGCDPVGRWSTTDAIGLDDSADVLENACGNLGFVGARWGAWLDEFFGRVTVAKLSPQGTWVVGLHAATGALFRWQAATFTTEAVGVIGPWRVDSLAAVNASAAIAAHATNTTTGRGAALLLTPAK